jgi:hypothetical protein
VAEPDYLSIKDRAAARILALPGVHAIGVGAKQVGGQRTNEVAIAVFVEHKRPLDEIPPDERVPAEIDGVKTDVIEMPVPTILQTGPGVLFGVDRVDDHERRPVRGGTACGRPGRGHGTLGCVFTVAGDPNVVLAATNHHVVYENCSDTANHEEVGQPDGDDSSSGCCNDIVGRVRDAQCDGEVDIALVQLKAGMQWLPEVWDVGPVRGVHPVTAQEANPPHTFAVKMRGRTSGRTGGAIVHIGLAGTVKKHDGTVHRNYTNAMLIVPNPDPAKPGTGTDFTRPGDSGSALLSATDELVGIVFAGTDATATTNGTGFAFPIKDLLDKFTTGLPPDRRIALQVATADHPGDIRTVPGAAMAAHPAPAITPAEARRLEAEIRTAPQGAWYADLYRRHREELTALVQTNRRVNVAWHRSGAAELFQWFVRAFAKDDVRVPTEIQGRPPSACLQDLAAAVARSASAPLRADVDRVLPTVPQIGGLTHREILERLAGPTLATTPAGG